jgi:uncharacterized protein YndB with AHSA1/START domain
MTMMPVSQITADQDAVVTEIEIAAPPERVFEALTDPAQLMLWWAATPKGALWEMDARPGGKWRYELTDPSRKKMMNGVRDFKAHGEITEFDPPRVLAYTWLGNWHEHPERPCTARWELSATKTGTRVKVTQQRPRQRTSRPQGLRGWLARRAGKTEKTLRIEKPGENHGHCRSYSRQ